MTKRAWIIAGTVLCTASPTAAWCQQASAVGGAAAAPASTTVATGAASAAGGEEAAHVAAQVQVYRQVGALSLTPEHVKDITDRLSHLAAAEDSYAAERERALSPVAPQLQRLRTALLAGATPNAKDQAAVDAASATLKPRADALRQLRKEIVDALRVQLSRAQLDAVRIDVGMDPAPQATGFGGFGAAGGGSGGAAGNPGGGPNPGGGNAGGANAGPGAGAAGGGFGGGAGGFGGLGGGALANPTSYGGMMLDRLRAIPPDRFDQVKDQAADRVLSMSGAQPNTPQYTDLKTAFIGQLEQIRAMPDDQYQQNRATLVTDMTNRFLPQFAAMMNAQGAGQGAPAGGPAGAPGAGGAMGGRGAQSTLDSEAVRKFFTQPEVLGYLKNRAASR